MGCLKMNDTTSQLKTIEKIMALVPRWNQIMEIKAYPGKNPEAQIAKLCDCIKQSESNVNTYFKCEPNDEDEDTFFIARRFNSYTPSIPRDREYEGCKGGGYVLSWKGKKIAIDPGYNFLENISISKKLGISKINGVVITHSHPDHTSDFENILTLLYELNEQNGELSPEHKIDLYMNLSSSQKFLYQIKQHDYIKYITILNRSQSHILEGYNIILETICCKHREFGTGGYSVGLKFKLYKDIKNKMQPELILGITGDTGWYEGLSNNFKDAQLLVIHIGGIKEYEISAEKIPTLGELNDLKEFYYPYHLGLLGTYHLLCDVDSELAVLSEFGSEFLSFIESTPIDFRVQICYMLENLLKKNEKKIRVIPGDIGLTIGFRSGKLKIFCSECQKWTDPMKITYTSNPPNNQIYPPIKYLCSRCIDKSFLFTWNDVPTRKYDTNRFTDFLMKKFGDVDWKKANIEKDDSDMTINATTENHSLSLMLDNDKTKAVLNIDDGRRTYEFIMKMDDGELNVHIDTDYQNK